MDAVPASLAHSDWNIHVLYWIKLASCPLAVRWKRLHSAQKRRNFCAASSSKNFVPGFLGDSLGILSIGSLAVVCFVCFDGDFENVDHFDHFADFWGFWSFWSFWRFLKILKMLIIFVILDSLGILSIGCLAVVCFVCLLTCSVLIFIYFWCCLLLLLFDCVLRTRASRSQRCHGNYAAAEKRE